MKLDIFSIDDFIEQNHCQEVTDPVFFSGDSTPRENGLFSYEIFGMSDNDRKNRFGYIDLVGNDTNTHYLHPLVYVVMSRLGSIKNLLNGSQYAIIDNRKVVMIPNDKVEQYQNAGTGIEFLYDNWENINWLGLSEEEEIESIDKKSRLRFLKLLKKNEAFITKWIVMPPFYREQSSGKKGLGDSINELYKSLISRVNSMKSGGRFSFFGDESKFKIQLLLIQLFNETTRVVKGKGSLLRKHLIGKTIDYTASNVITSPQISASDSLADFPVPFGYCRCPLPTLLSLFQPFFVNKIAELFSRFLVPSIYLYANNDVKKIDYSLYNTEAAEKLIKLFIKSPTERFRPMSFEYTNMKGEKIEGIFKIYETENENDAKANRNWTERPFTIADMFCMIAGEVLEDKHIYVTRYPVTNFKNIYPSKIKIATTTRTRKRVFMKMSKSDDKYFTAVEYPYIKWDGNPNPKPESYYNFIEVFVPGNAYLAATGADYDGDMIKVNKSIQK